MTLAALCTALVVLLVIPPPQPLPSRGRSPAAAHGAWIGLSFAALSPILLLHGSTLALALILAAAGTALAGLRQRERARRAADARRLTVIEACEAMASELRSGQPPTQALAHAAGVWPGLQPAASAARLDADVPAALRRAGDIAGAGALARVGAAWAVTLSVGGGLAQALDRVVDRARGELATHRVVASELASAVATARMVAALPVVVLALSSGSGGDPWHFLLETPAGLGTLAAGLALAVAGLWWIDRIVARVAAGDA